MTVSIDRFSKHIRIKDDRVSWRDDLQVGGQIVSFLTRHLGYPIPSPAVLDQIGQRFRRQVDSYAKANDIPVVRFAKGQRKVDVMRPLMRQAEIEGRSRVVAIAWAQEYALVASAVTTRTPQKAS